MKGSVAAIVAMALVASLTWCIAADTPVTTTETATPAATAAKPCYVCEKCGTISMTMGKCPKCQMDMKGSHVVAIKDGNAYCCSCGDECKCKPVGDDLTNCSCGKPLMKMSLKGKYVCACGAACSKCTPIADAPGKCACGMDLKKVE